MIIARTEALIAELGMREAIQRANAYEKAGADAILIHSKKNTPDEVIEFSESWNGNIPLIVVPTTYPDVSIEELIKNKFKMIIYANADPDGAVGRGTTKCRHATTRSPG